MFTGNLHLKYVSLVLLTLQNAALILVMRYTRTREGDLYLPSSAVIMTEILKCVVSLSVLFYQLGCQPKKLFQNFHENVFNQPGNFFKISVPSLIYVLQNNLLYVALSNLEAATFQVTYQIKILTTALFSVFMLNKHVSHRQWIALVILFIGVGIVQLKPQDLNQNSESESQNSGTSQNQNHLLGLFAVFTACLMSGFAGVFFEKMVRKSSQSLWWMNVQLSFLGIFIGVITMKINDGEQLLKGGFFQGYDWVVWIVIFLQSFGGLTVAVVVKYADNILKGFATSAAIVISCITSIYFFDFQMSMGFSFGTALVIFSVYMYSAVDSSSKKVQ